MLVMPAPQWSCTHIWKGLAGPRCREWCRRVSQSRLVSQAEKACCVKSSAGRLKIIRDVAETARSPTQRHQGLLADVARCRIVTRRHHQGDVGAGRRAM